MLKDLIYRSRNANSVDPSRLLPYNFFGQYLPVSLNIEETFKIHGNVPQDWHFQPRRCIYIDEIKHYLILDLAQPTMATIYLVNGESHEVVGSYTYLVELCPNYTQYDEITDMCVHHEESFDKIAVSFLICNSHTRTASIARYNLDFKDMGLEHDVDSTNPRYQIKLSDLQFFANLVASGKPDEIALGYELKTATAQGSTCVYPEPKVDTIVNILKSSFFVGTFNTKYCNIAIDEAGRYVVLIGSRIKVWLGPHLSANVDTQYIVVLDKGGMNMRFALLGPTHNCLSFDEGEEHQPYKYSLTMFDGRYILSLEDKKSRYLNPKRVSMGANTDDPHDSYIFCNKAWGGGAVADKYYPAREISAGPPGGGNVRYIGYATDWEATSNPEPTEREAIWTIIDVCDLFAGLSPELQPPTAPYQADIVFLVDTSGSMGPHISQIQGNIKNFMNTLNALHVTDLRIGVAAYTTRQRSIYDTSTASMSMWTTSTSGAQSMVDTLRVGYINAGSQAWHWSALSWAASQYKYRTMKSRTKYIILITDAGDENDPISMASAIAYLNDQDIKVCVVSNNPGKYFDPLFTQTGGTLVSMSGAWGPVMAFDMAEKIAVESGASGETQDWWSTVAAAWQPTILYQYTPATDFTTNSYVTAYHENISYISNGSIFRNTVNFLTIYDDYPAEGGRPQDSLYCPGLIPGETMNMSFLVRNESNTGTMKRMEIELLDKPDDVTVTLNGFPTELGPKETAILAVEVAYNPSNTDAGTRHLDIHYKVSYWMQHILSCSYRGRGDGQDSEQSFYDLYFVEDTQQGNFIPGLSKQITFDPLYTLAYVTATAYEEGDATYQQSWISKRLYVLTDKILQSQKYESISPGAISGIVGQQISTTGCCWLKVRGPLYWETNREYELKYNKKTWYIVNQSDTRSYVGHVVLEQGSLPNQSGMGFILINYPEGNIIKPGQSVPVEMYWQAIFNPSGEEMTHKVEDYTINNNSQDGAVGTIWDQNPGFFNHIIYTMPTGMTARLTHLYSEKIKGDGMDIPVKPDQPLQKFDVKLLGDSVYETMTYLDVDLNTVPDKFRWLIPGGIWGGIRDDDSVNDLQIPPGVKPEDMFAYVEWLSPASGLPILPAYIDHKFRPNPEFLFNSDTPNPYQLTPFNKLYADPYMATLFVGNVLIKSETVTNVMIADFDVYDDPGAELVPCDSSGAEKAGWLLEDFWPVSGDFEESVKKLATENDYIFTKTLYVKNRGNRTLPVKLMYGASVVHGFSIQDVTIVNNPTLAPGDISELVVTFRFHYTYWESKYVNMVKECMYIPRFEVPLSV